MELANLTFLASICLSSFLISQEGKLPQPSKTGMPLMEALAKRASGREFSPKPLTKEHLGDILWAGVGINRPDGKKTSPTARNFQEITVYAAMKQGLFMYDPKEHSLVKIKNEDLRELTGKQPFVATVPVNLVFVAEEEKMGNMTADKKIYYGAIDTGFVSQNIYLYCASQGISTVVRAYLDPEKLQKAMGLKPTHKVIAAQSIGYPK